MAEEKALELFGSETLVFELKEEFLNKQVNVEFCCGQHVKKAVGGRLVEVGRDFIELVRTDDQAITVILFGDDNQKYQELDEKIIIPLDRVCSVEDPCKPCHKEPCHEPDVAEEEAKE
ncbi:MAG: hypothetical protein ABSA82_06015 [Thermacetogeniaceae bacterium]|jgi:hypothetical protein